MRWMALMVLLVLTLPVMAEEQMNPDGYIGGITYDISGGLLWPRGNQELYPEEEIMEKTNIGGNGFGFNLKIIFPISDDTSFWIGSSFLHVMNRNYFDIRDLSSEKLSTFEITVGARLYSTSSIWTK